MSRVRIASGPLLRFKVTHTNRKHKIRNPEELLREIEKSKTLPLVIVEGKKDKTALESLGFKNILVLHHDGTSLFSILDQIEEKGCKECAILTDFDRKGRQYYNILKKELVKRGIKVNDRFRNALMKKKISHIEGLDTFLKNNILE